MNNDFEKTGSFVVQLFLVGYRMISMVFGDCYCYIDHLFNSYWGFPQRGYKWSFPLTLIKISRWYTTDFLGIPSLMNTWLLRNKRFLQEWTCLSSSQGLHAGPSVVAFTCLFLDASQRWTWPDLCEAFVNQTSGSLLRALRELKRVDEILQAACGRILSALPSSYFARKNWKIFIIRKSSSKWPGVSLVCASAWCE